MWRLLHGVWRVLCRAGSRRLVEAAEVCGQQPSDVGCYQGVNGSGLRGVPLHRLDPPRHIFALPFTEVLAQMDLEGMCDAKNIFYVLFKQLTETFGSTRAKLAAKLVRDHPITDMLRNMHVASMQPTHSLFHWIAQRAQTRGCASVLQRGRCKHYARLQQQCGHCHEELVAKLVGILPTLPSHGAHVEDCDGLGDNKQSWVSCRHGLCVLEQVTEA